MGNKVGSHYGYQSTFEIEVKVYLVTNR